MPGGVYTAVDLIKRDQAFIIFRTIADDMGENAFLIAKQAALFKKADAVIEGLAPAPAPSGGDFPPAAGAPATA